MSSSPPPIITDDIIDDNNSNAFSSYNDLNQFSSTFINNNNLSSIDLSSSTLTNALLYGIIINIDSEDDVIANVWADVLLDIIDKNVIKANDPLLCDILEITLRKGESDSPEARLLCGKILSRICPLLEKCFVDNKILPMVQSLCQDIDCDVRANMCQQLFSISQSIGLETIISKIIPQLLELSKDKESYVRIACIQTIIDLLPILDAETLLETMMPLIIAMFDDALQCIDSTLPFICSQFGRMFLNFISLVNNFNNNNNDENWFLNFYCHSVRLNTSNKCAINLSLPDLLPQEDQMNDRLIQCRASGALNFPILMQFYGANNDLLTVLESFCSDENIVVVKNIALKFKEIVDILNDPHIIYSQFSLLLINEHIEVLKHLVKDLPDLINKILSTVKASEKDFFIYRLLQDLTKCEQTLSQSLNWRLHTEMLHNLILVYDYVTLDLIHENLIPLLINRIKTARPIPVRLTAANCLLRIYEVKPLLCQTLDIYTWLVNNLCFAKSFHQRMLFLKICINIYEVGDATLIKSYFFEPLLSLYEDKVPNIRLCLCRTLSLFFSVWKTYEFYPLVTKLEQHNLKLLTTEKDRDVLESSNQLNELIHSYFKQMNKVLVAKEDVPPLQLNDNNGAINGIKTFSGPNNKLNDFTRKSSLPQLKPNHQFLAPTNRNLRKDELRLTFPSKIPKFVKINY